MIRVGILGYGYWGELLATRALALPVAYVVAIADQAIDKRNRAKLLPDMVVGRNLDDLLQEGISAVIVATPASTHQAIVRTALEAGMHVFCEKPLALTSSACAKLVDLAEQRGRVLHVDHTFLFMEQFKQIESIIRNDPIQCYGSDRINLSSGRDDVSIIEDLAIHDLALLDALTADQPTTITLNATSWPSPDSATLVMKFASGCSAWVRVGWRQAFRRRDIIIANQQAIIIWRDSLVTVRRRGTGEVLSPNSNEDRGDALSSALNGFFECIETSTLTNVEARRATRIASTLERVRDSMPARTDFGNA
jgi:predicted dehydrogenase